VFNVHMWSVRVQIHLSCCVYAGSFNEFQCFEVKPEDITECPRDDKPSTGMFAISNDTDPLSLICHSLFFKVRRLMN